MRFPYILRSVIFRPGSTFSCGRKLFIYAAEGMEAERVSVYSAGKSRAMRRPDRGKQQKKHVCIGAYSCRKYMIIMNLKQNSKEKQREL